MVSNFYFKQKWLPNSKVAWYITVSMVEQQGLKLLVLILYMQILQSLQGLYWKTKQEMEFV
jgi:hypothetical protein